MDDNQNGDKNQSPESTVPKPIYESVPVDDSVNGSNLQPEEISADISSAQDAFNKIPDVPSDSSHPVYSVSEDGRGKFIISLVVIAFFILVAGAVYFFLAKFRSNDGGTKTPALTEDITLNYWGLWEEKEVYQPLIDEYQSKNPHVKIKYEKLSPEQYREKLLARKENGPDIFRFHGTWLPEIQEVVAPLPDTVMTNAEYEKTFYPIFQRDLKLGEKYYGIPLYLDGLVLIYNDTLLKQAGITSAPNVWISQGSDQNDMLTAVGKLTVKDASSNLVTSGLAAGTTGNTEHFSELFGLLLLLNGGDLKKLDSPQAADALQLYRKFAEENYWNDTMPNSISAFVQGKVAMIIAPSWQVLSIKAQNPELVVKVAPVPRGLDGKAVSISNYWAEGVSKYSKNQVEAWKFLKFLSSKESETKMFELQSKIRPFGAAYSRVDLADQLTNNEFLQPVIAQAEAYKTLPLVTRTFDNGLNDNIVSYIRNAINATTQGADYAAALSQAKQGIDQVLKQYKIE